MTAAEVLRHVRGAAAANRVQVSGHAWQRAGQRGLTAADLRLGLMSATSATKQENERWKLETADRDGDPFALIVDLGPPVIVVTVFG